MIIGHISEIEKHLNCFSKYKCVIIIAKYNSGKSSIATSLIYNYFRKENTEYITFIDQSKPNFTPKDSKRELGELVRDKIVILKNFTGIF